MQFDPKKWTNIKPGSKFASPGRVEINSSRESVVLVEGIVASVGNVHKFSTTIGQQIEVQADGKTIISTSMGLTTTLKPEGDIYTAIDRVPGRSYDATRVGLYKKVKQDGQKMAQARRDLIEAKLDQNDLDEEERKVLEEEFKEWQKEKAKKVEQEQIDREEFEAEKKRKELDEKRKKEKQE
jgi:hypothetical protein